MWDFEQRQIPPKMVQTPAQQPQWLTPVAGAFAGFVSRCVCAPLDLVKIRLQLAPTVVASAPLPSATTATQTARKVVSSEGGPSALFKGNLAAIYLWVGYAAIQFTVYDAVKVRLSAIQLHAEPESPHHQLPWWLVPIPTHLPSPLISFTAGASAGLLSTCVTYPFDICRTALASQSSLFSAASIQPKSITDFVVNTFAAKGFRGFYAGVGAACASIVPLMGSNFLIYDAGLKVIERNNLFGGSDMMSSLVAVSERSGQETVGWKYPRVHVRFDPVFWTTFEQSLFTKRCV